jgi:hypothetical protein
MVVAGVDEGSYKAMALGSQQGVVNNNMHSGQSPWIIVSFRKTELT